jgi:dTDP-4-dehydrorhamnose reductase
LKNIREDVDADNFETVTRAFSSIEPEIVINCIGIIKQTLMANDPLSAIAINSLFPHRISMACRSTGARLIQMSTDCVFDGKRGSYTEKDVPDATDLYGRSKLLGEVEGVHCLTIRKSLIGHELRGKLGLIEWFFAQEGRINGFTRAIFTGLPTIELARIIIEHVIPNENLKGLYHVASNPISKYELLRLVAERYGKKIEIIPYDKFQQNRSLDSFAFREATGYNPPSWPELVDRMYRHYVASSYDKNSR